MFDFRLAYYNDLSATSKDKELIKPKLMINSDDSPADKKAKTELISLLMLFRYHKNSIPPNNQKLEKCLELMDHFCKENKQLGITFKECMLFAKNRYSITAEIPKSLVEVYKNIPEANMSDFIEFSRNHQLQIAPELNEPPLTICQQFFEFLTEFTKRFESDMFKIPTRGRNWIDPKKEFWKDGGDRDTGFGFNAFARSIGLTNQGRVSLNEDAILIPEEWGYWIAGVSVKENAIFSYCSEKPEKINDQVGINDHENRYKVTPYQAARALSQMTFKDYIDVNEEDRKYTPLTEEKREHLLTAFKALVAKIPSRDLKDDSKSLNKKNIQEIKSKGESEHSDSRKTPLSHK